MELWDLYTQDRQKTGRTHVRGAPLPEGLFHLVVHVWLKNSRGQYLISQRAESRPSFPLMWETTGSSVLTGEDSLQGALREAREELGIRLRPENGRLLFSRVRYYAGGRRFGDIVDVWLFGFDGAADLSLADGEVKTAQWMDKTQVARLLESGAMVSTLSYFVEDIDYGIAGT